MSVVKPIFLSTCMGIWLLTSSCFYNFSGSALGPEVKSIQINNFPNRASLFNPNLSQTFTNDLIDRFVTRSNLNIATNNGDLSLNGEITNYQISPVNVGVGSDGNATANQNRLTISVKVNYINSKEPDKSWSRTFTDSEPFDANETLANVEDELVSIINERIISQVFNAVVSDW